MFTDAIVLKTWPYSESTLVASLLTREYGVIRGLAKGARRLKGRSASAFDLYSHIRTGVRVRSRDALNNLGSVELQRAFLYLHRDLDRLAFASVGMEILGAVAGASPEEPFFFDEASDYLALMETSEAPGSLTGALLWRLLHHAGHPPRLSPELNLDGADVRPVYDFAEGMVVSADELAPAAGRMALPAGLIRHLAPAFARPPHLDDRLAVPARYGRAFLAWLVHIWADSLNQSFASFDFLEKAVLDRRAKEKEGESKK